MPFTPLLGIAFSIWLITKLQPATWVRFAVWFLIGVIIYAAYGYRHSKLGHGVAVQTKDT
jgi:basic amino acid/polyamine antiporter, APA family